MSLRVELEGEKASKFWKKEALRSLKRNKRLAWDVRQAMRRVTVTTPAGVFLGNQVMGHWSAEAHDPVIDKMIRGLYFHHFKEILGDKVTIKVQWLRGLNADLRQLCAELPIVGSLAGGIFEYRGGRTEGRPTAFCVDLRFLR